MAKLKIINPPQGNMALPIEFLEGRNKVMNIVNQLKYIDGYTDSQTKKKSLKEVLSVDSANIMDDLLEIYKATRFQGVSSKQYLIEYNNNFIYVNESNNFLPLLEQIVELCQSKSESFGKGSEGIVKVLFEKNPNFPKSPYPKATISELDYFRLFLMNQSVFLNFNDSMICLQFYRNEKHNKEYKLVEFEGGLLHTLQHFQIYGNIPSSINKTGKPKNKKVEFHSDLFFSLIIEALFFRKRNKKLIDEKNGGKNYLLEFTYRGNRYEISYFINQVGVYFLNSLYYISKKSKRTKQHV